MTGTLSDPLYDALAAVHLPCFVVAGPDGVRAANDERVARTGQVLAVAAPQPRNRLGAGDFGTHHGVRYAYMSGAMANQIASPDLVVAMARAGYLASYGAAGTVRTAVDDSLAGIRRRIGDLPFACNLIHSPSEPEMERSTVQLCIKHQVTTIEASAFIDLTPHIVHYRVSGLRRDRDGTVVTGHRVVAKLSRTEVAERFLLPAPESMVRDLLEAGRITPEQAELAARVPMADDITAEADSGGHTDRRPLSVLLPEIIRLRDRIQAERGYRRPVRVGAAGGLGTPEAVLAAYAMGAAYVVTGSVNQATIESGQSAAAKALLAGAGMADCDMSPSSDMFELGVQVQVLRSGTMFPTKAKRLYELYRAHEGVEHLPEQDREWLESRVLRKPVEQVWQETVEYFERRDPEQIQRAADHPKRRMALIFRWYLGLSSTWSIGGEPSRVADYQIWCGPAQGAFNTWVRGSYLEPVTARSAPDIAGQLLRGAAFAARVNQLRLAGVRLPARSATYRPQRQDG